MFASKMLHNRVNFVAPRSHFVCRHYLIMFLVILAVYLFIVEKEGTSTSYIALVVFRQIVQAS